MRLAPLVLAFITLLGCAPPAAARSSKAPKTVADVYPEVIGSVALIEVRGVTAEPGPRGQVVAAEGLGSGVLISQDGLVLTAAHVVQAVNSIRVYFTTDEGVEAKVIRTDPASDVALLQLSSVPSGVRVAKLGDSDAMRVGEQVFVVGAPLGISHTLSVGHLSARRVPDALSAGLSTAELFQTDAAINQGNSGGPMFNMKGEVVGVVSHIVSLTGGSEGLGFAVTSNAARSLVVDKPGFWGGVSGRMLQGELAAVFNVPQSHGLLIEVVARDSPAAALGLRGGGIKATIAEQELIVGGDIVLEVQGIAIAGPESLLAIREALAKIESGQTLSVEVLRDGKVQTLRTSYEPPV